MKMHLCSSLVGVILVGNLFPDARATDSLDFWQWRNPLPTGNVLYDVTIADGVFVAVGEYGTIMTSADGLGWTKQLSGSPTLFPA